MEVRSYERCRDSFDAVTFEENWTKRRVHRFRVLSEVTLVNFFLARRREFFEQIF